MSRILAAMSLTVVTLAVGCHCNRCRSYVAAPPCPPPCAPGIAVPGGRPPVVAPPPATYAPQYSPPPVIQGQHNYQPPVQQPRENTANQTWRPAPSDSNYGRDNAGTDPNKPYTKLLPPAEEKPRARLQPPTIENPEATVRVSTDPTSPDFPVDIPQFQQVNGNVYSGLQPFPDGWSWLKERGFRTIVNLRPVGEDDTATKENVERRGMRYVSFEVSPQKLDRALVDQFAAIVKDSGTHPLFVYDRRGMIAGSVWYLQFKLIENHADAKARAVRLGLKEETSGEFADWWLAINKLLGSA